jgi:uncharacterized protein (TIGR02001 family)
MLFSLALGCFAPQSHAADPAEVAGGPATETTESPAAEIWMFDATFGAALTSDYMFRGITQTDHEPALQGYLEPSYGIFYAGAWASNVDFRTPDPDVEVDLYGGLRPTFGPFNADIGYVHYLYPEAEDTDYGEVKAAVSASPVEAVTLSGVVYHSFDYAQSGDDATYFEGNAAIALPYDITVSGAVGFQSFDSGVGLSDYATWNVGASYSWNAVTLDLRYWDTDVSSGTCEAEYPRENSCDARVVATVKVDTSWSALRALTNASP